MLRQTRYRFVGDNPLGITRDGVQVALEPAASYELEFNVIMTGRRYTFLGRMASEKEFSATTTSSEITLIRLVKKDGKSIPLSGTDYSVEDYLRKHGGHLAVNSEHNLYVIEVE